ncbi:MAG TPA: rhodanese-like domain-containing protein, partial [Chloroflexota bacterium]
KGYWGGLKRAPAEWYAERLRDCGLRRDDAIVVYADGPGSRGREGRIAWMLLYLGAPSVMLLDGGWNAWLELGGDVEKEPTTLGSGDFRVSFQAHRRCSVTQLADEWMSPARPQLVDTRSVAEFAGEVQPYLPRRGHLPGAVLVSFSSLFDAGGRFIDRETYLTLLPAAARRPDNIVAFCEVGVRASLFALLHEMYAGSVVRVCDGSLIEWGLASGLPLETDTPLTA